MERIHLVGFPEGSRPFPSFVQITFSAPKRADEKELQNGRTLFLISNINLYPQKTIDESCHLLVLALLARENTMLPPKKPPPETKRRVIFPMLVLKGYSPCNNSHQLHIFAPWTYPPSLQRAHTCQWTRGVVTLIHHISISIHPPTNRNPNGFDEDESNSLPSPPMHSFHFGFSCLLS